MRACSMSEQDSHIPLDRRMFLRWLSRWWRGQHESGSPSFSIMSTKVQYYLERAEHCERMAALTSNREVRANFAELAQQWRDLARQHQKSSATIKLTHCPLAINPTDAVAMGNRRSRKGVECRRHRSVGHRPASRHPARARPEVPRWRTGSPPLGSQSGDSAAAVVPRPCACP